MSTIKIAQSNLKGAIIAPPSKSAAHRALICASLANGKSIIRNIELSVDIKTTIEVIKGIGIEINEKLNSDGRYDIIINGSFERYLNLKEELFYFRQSGSTLRFFIPLLLMGENEKWITLDGDLSLANRPLTTYFKVFEDKGISYEKMSDATLPLMIKGKLNYGDYFITSNESSQYITGLLFALPLLKGNSKVILEEKMESKDYISLTRDILRDFNIVIEEKEYGYYIEGNQRYISKNFIVEGDFSNSSVFVLLGLSQFKNNIQVDNLKYESSQADSNIFEIKNYMEKCISLNQSINLDLRENIDTALYIIIASIFISGLHEFTGIKRLRIKESDRLSAICEILERLNVKYNLIETEDDAKLKVFGREENINTIREFLKNNQIIFNSKSDHRIVMVLTMIGIICGNIIIEGAEDIGKSYPSFFEDIKRLGGVVREFNYRE